MKKLLSIILAIVMTITVVPLSVFAYEGEPAEPPVQEEYQQTDDEIDEGFSVIEILAMPLAVVLSPIYIVSDILGNVIAAGALGSFFSLTWIVLIFDEIGELIRG